jgi:hypothetical protein|tara:strand:+ start:758 stop:1294 length:537 start_codon:yes stop_codon:yes gene_type:complete
MTLSRHLKRAFKMIKLIDIIFEGKLSKSEIKKMKDKFDKTGKLPPHLQKLADLMKKNTKVKDIVVPGLEWMAEEKLKEVYRTKRGLEVIKHITGGKTSQFGNMTKSNWIQHHETGIVFGRGGGTYKGGSTGAQIFSQGSNKYTVEIVKGVPPKPKILKKIKNVEGDMLYSTLKQYLGI